VASADSRQLAGATERESTGRVSLRALVERDHRLLFAATLVTSPGRDRTMRGSRTTTWR
jgi:hypothetical protein